MPCPFLICPRMLCSSLWSRICLHTYTLVLHVFLLYFFVVGCSAFLPFCLNVLNTIQYKVIPSCLLVSLQCKSLCDVLYYFKLQKKNKCLNSEPILQKKETKKETYFFIITFLYQSTFKIIILTSFPIRNPQFMIRISKPIYRKRKMRN